MDQNIRSLAVRSLLGNFWRAVSISLARINLYGIFVAILFILNMPDVARGQECIGGIPANQTDSLALVALYNATGGSSWSYPVTDKTWLQRPVRDWLGVILFNCRVWSLSLNGMNLVGTLPNDLGNLTAVKSISINGQSGENGDLHGPIPSILGTLNNLETLSLGNNNLSGEIPAELGELANLIVLSLSGNRLEGPIPPELGNATNLKGLNLSQNQLTGAIPTELGNLMNATSIQLDNNKLKGTVPQSFASLNNLQTLRLQDNQLEDLPDLTSLSALTRLWLWNNRFTFEDLEPNVPLFSQAQVLYHPQAEVETNARSMGSDVLLSVNVGGQNNVYQWFKDGVVINGATETTFSVLSADLNDASQYRCSVTNTLVTGLTIISRRVSLQQAAFVVNSAGDQSDPTPNDNVCDVDPSTAGDQCTLRAAIETVNAMRNVTARPVVFDIPGGGVPVISPPVALPIIKFPIVIDGTTQTAGRVRLTGPGGDVIGVAILANGCTVKGLLIDGFRLGLGVLGNANTVEENVIVSNKRGINIVGNNNTIGKNIVAGNDDEGIVIYGGSDIGTTGNTIEDNLIGTEGDGFTPLPNGIGVAIAQKLAHQNTIKNNLISANKTGILLLKNEDNTVEGNRIGTTADGKSPLGNDIGVLLEESEKNIIKNNVISDSRQSGIFVSKGSQNVIDSNKIGTDASGTAALGNGEHGVEIVNSNNNQIKDNVISGNEGAGVFISGPLAKENTLRNNKIGTNATGTAPLGNEKEGVLIQDVMLANVLYNLISANGKSGVAVEGIEAPYTRVFGNSIGTDIFGNDVFGVMGNREHGVLIDRAPSSSLEANMIAFNQSAGILLLETPSVAVEGNNIHHNVVGIDIQGEGSNKLRITGNRIHLNVTNINASNAEFIAQNNNVFSGTGTGTGIHLMQSNAVIRGNLLSGDAGDAIALELGSTALITKNNIFSNQGFGLNNLDPTVTITAQANWWGDASGPGGTGPGTGDEVSTGVDFSNWLAQPVAVVVTAEGDTVTLATGISDTVSLFLQNWQKLDDVVNVSISDDQEWLQQPAVFSVNLTDSLGAEIRIAFVIPVSTSDGSSDHVQVIATSQSDPSAVDTTRFVVVSQNAVLVSLFVTPDSVALSPGDSVKFVAEGTDQFGRDFNFTPQWSATGGSIDVEGLYIAGNQTGTFQVTATDPNTQITAQAVVLIDVSVAVEEDAAEVPTEFRLYQNYPNPFNPETQILYDLPKAAHVRIEIFNILGQRIKTLVDEQKPAGAYSLIWDGRTDNSEAATSGVYIYRLKTNEFVKSRKLLLLR